MGKVNWKDKEFERYLTKQVIIPKLNKACLLVLAEAKRLMANAGPLHAVDTGRLMNSLTWEVLAKDLVARIGTNVKYAIYVFLGTYSKDNSQRMIPRPILRTALANMKSQIQALFS